MADDEMTPEEIARAEEIGPPDFLLVENFDAENAAVKPPEERLEFLRFFVIEGDANFKHHLSEWMQEVERQLEALRKRLNDLPSEYARKGPVW